MKINSQIDSHYNRELGGGGRRVNIIAKEKQGFL